MIGHSAGLVTGLNELYGTKLRADDLILHYIAHKDIVTHEREIMVNFELKSNCQHHLSSSVRKWYNTFQQSVDIFRKISERLDETNVLKLLT